ncbi:hypothetical protein FA15DRAFT_710550 [Coprinopsis marcescibilis]|uniref:Uncharacterized protein n=1 Tax=Coprinopsis marcescibilis TaxID=230819 RepID=A0A5C3KCH9_COPMA|nr:hypothetical protein FA15DRAFT_710550 [Coprinopsis marcescibilis]
MFPLLLLPVLVAAAPRSLHPRQQQPNDDRRATSFSPQIWLPVVGVVVFIFILAIFSWSNKRIRARIGRSVNASNNVPQGPRELTAEQLAGTINGNANGALPRTRRARRPRRTPSQMSVTSLPAYNKEPGDLELVIIRQVLPYTALSKSSILTFSLLEVLMLRTLMLRPDRSPLE